MSNIFDTRSGEVHIGNQIRLRSSSKPEDLTAAGLSFVKEFNMENGWVFRTLEPIHIAGRLAKMSLGFFNGLLRKLVFGFACSAEQNMYFSFGEYNAFLLEELGEPTGQDIRRALYQYEWGQILSEMDLRK
jgi:hypothetical protein